MQIRARHGRLELERAIGSAARRANVNAKRLANVWGEKDERGESESLIRKTRTRLEARSERGECTGEGSRRKSTGEGRPSDGEEL